VAFVVREKLEHVTAWLLHITEYLDLHHAYTNNCTVYRYNDIQIFGKPTCFGLFRPHLGSYSTKKGTVMACTFLKMAEKTETCRGLRHVCVSLYLIILQLLVSTWCLALLHGTW
jgi:hypothetical protein